MAVTIDGTTGVSLVQDGVVQTADLANNAVTSAKLFSGFANGITMAEHWALTSNLTVNGIDTIIANLAISSGTGSIGSSMTQSSGVFTFPETGVYLVRAILSGKSIGSSLVYGGIRISLSTDGGSNYTTPATSYSNSSITDGHMNADASYFVDVTSTANVKVKFSIETSASCSIFGSSVGSATHFEFIRLGDT